jgi:complement component 1 Q subcomponent-binding protein, mitochondrial
LTADEALVAKLDQERALELQSQETEMPPLIKEYLENSAYQIQDNPGSQDIVLTRDFGNEKYEVNQSVMSPALTAAESRFS